MLDLVGVELAEVLQVDPALARVRHGDGAAQRHLRLRLRHALNRPDHIGELAHAGGLNEDAVGAELVQHLFQRLPEVPHQGAADAPGIHLRDLDARVLQKAAVDADFAELIFNEHNLLAPQGLVQQLFDQRRLARAQKAGDHIYFCHRKYASFSIISLLSYSIFRKKQGGIGEFPSPRPIFLRGAPPASPSPPPFFAAGCTRTGNFSPHAPHSCGSTTTEASMS